MKKTILIFTLILLTLVMAACGGTSSEPAAQNTASNEVTASNNADAGSTTTTASGEPQFDLPAETTLMLGTVKLDETSYAVDADQASQLLPLWKALRSLGESETAAQAELDAVVAQIEDSMTPEQISEIEAMALTMQDMAGVAEILGVEMGCFGGRMGELTPEMQATMEAARESGQLPAGGPGGRMGLRGGQGPGGAEMDPAARETAMAERGGTRGARSGINSVLLDALIEFLETKIQ